MQKITPEDPITHSTDVLAENVEQLRDLFPEAFTESGVDFEVLKQLLGGVVDEGEEKYGLNWHGKRRARQLALTPSTGTLRPCPEESVDWETTQNLMIEGDNLEVLKLLQKSYSGKVKLLYIDPPYNTGKDFVYSDNFRDSIQNYLELTGQVDCTQAKKTSNTESSGRFHTDWLNMMFPRLKAAHSMLKSDGAVFVSCDEAEHVRLRFVLDEVFGQENFIADMVWAAGRKNDSRFISVSHEYIVCYARDRAKLRAQGGKWRQRKKGLEDIYQQHERLERAHGENFAAITKALKDWYRSLADDHPSKAHRHYSSVDSRGVYFPADISWPGGGGPKYAVLHPVTKNPVVTPKGGWRFSDPLEMERRISEDLIHFGVDESSVPCRKSYLSEHEDQTPYSVFYQDGRAASKRLQSLMGCRCFDFPKDETVLQEIIGMASSGNDIIMDFFAGSGTTGHAVMLQNAVDGGGRNYILVQLPEALDPANKKQRTAAEFCSQIGSPGNIAELTKERLRRAAGKLEEENPLAKGDLGFRVFKLDRSNIRAWDASPDNLETALFESMDHLQEGRTEDDVLFELLLKLGLDLCVPIEVRTITNYTIHSVGAGTLLVCLAKEIATDMAEDLALGIAAWHEEQNPAGGSTVVFRDSAFADDVAKTNIAAILEQHGLKNVRSL